MATSKDVARLAGVSRATVSAIFNGKAREQRIALDTEERVRAIAEKLGYRSPFYARSLSTGRSMSIGFVAIGDDAAAAQRCFASAAQRCHAAAHLLTWAGVQADSSLVEIPHPSLHDLAGGLAECLSDRHDGLIVFCREDEGIREACVQLLQAQSQLPIVFISDSAVELPLLVCSDLSSAWRSCADQLHMHGHRQALALVDNIPDTSDWPAQHPCRLSIASAAEDDAIAACWSERPERPTALICADLRQAMNAARLLSFNGRRVPEDCSLVCLAAAESAAAALPPAACIDRDWGRCAHVAADLLLQRLANAEVSAVLQRVHGRFLPAGGIGGRS